MTNLLTLRFWFNLRPETLSPLPEKAFIGFLIALFTLAVIVFFAKRHGGLYKGFFKRLYTFSLSNLVIGVTLYFFNYELIPFFSARFWIGIWTLVMIIWLFSILKKLKTIPAQKKKREQVDEIKKYLP